MGIPDHSDLASLRRWLMGEEETQPTEEKVPMPEGEDAPAAPAAPAAPEAEKKEVTEAEPQAVEVPVAEDCPVPDAAEAQGELEKSLANAEDTLSHVSWGSEVRAIIDDSLLRMIPDLQSALQWSICRGVRGPDFIKKPSSDKAAAPTTEIKLTAELLKEALTNLHDSLIKAKSAGTGIPMISGPAAIAVQGTLHRLRAAALAEADLAFAVAQQDKTLLPRVLRLAEHQGASAASLANAHNAMVELREMEKNLEEALAYAEDPAVDPGHAEARLTSTLKYASASVPKAALATAEAKLRALVGARRTANAEQALGVRAAVQGAWDDNGKVVKISASLAKRSGESMSLEFAPGGDILLGKRRGRLVCSEGDGEQRIEWDHGDSWPRSTLSDEEVEAELSGPIPAATAEVAEEEVGTAEDGTAEAPAAEETAEGGADIGETPEGESKAADADPAAKTPEPAVDGEAAAEPTPALEEGA